MRRAPASIRHPARLGRRLPRRAAALLRRRSPARHAHLLLHRAALRCAAALLRRRPSRRAGDGGAPVTLLLAHAFGMGGTVRTALNLASHLAADRPVHVVSLLRLRRRPFFPLPPGVSLTAVDDQRRGSRPAVRRALERLPSVLVHPAERIARRSTLWTDVQLLRVLWRIGDGAIIGTRPALNLLALALRRPGVTTVGAEHMHLEAHNPRVRREMLRRYPALDALVVLTEADRASFDAALGGATRVVRIPNSIPALPGPAADLADPVVLAAGRLTRQKGFDRLIEAYALVARAEPAWTLRIAGRGKQRRELERLIRLHGLEDRVTLLGAVRRFERELGRASIFALSSRFEGQPMVMLEAMSKGLPIVSFDCPTGPRDVMQDGREGRLVPDGDLEGFAAALLELIRDEPARRRCGAAAAATASGYALDAVGASWTALLDGDAASRPSR